MGKKNYSQPFLKARKMEALSIYNILMTVMKMT